MHVAVDALLLKNQNVGTGLYTHHLLKALSQLPSAHHFTVFADAAYHFASELESSRMRIEKVKLYGTAHRIAWEQLYLPKRLRNMQVDVALYPFFIAPAQSHVPSVVIIHDALIKVYPELIERPRRWYLDTMITHSIKQAACILTVSEYAKSDLVKHYGAKPARILLAPAAAAPHFEVKISEEERCAILHKYAVPFEQFFLSVGISHKYKNYIELLFAFRAALVENPALRLVMVGSAGNDQKAIDAFIAQHALHTQVFRARYVKSEDLRAFYASAVALVMTSHYESFAMPIVEAMHVGCPVIIANRTAMPETAGKAALRYDTVQDLTHRLLDMWSNEKLRQRLVASGYAQAKKFSWLNTAQCVLEALGKAVRAV
ncbi:MAG: glycosyltransferase family 4 protein [Candidatus Thermochlorobacter sp.]